ncbi:hypothetical protein Droror1_Dr00022336 [Drosera rotundifolia]
MARMSAGVRLARLSPPRVSSPPPQVPSKLPGFGRLLTRDCVIPSLRLIVPRRRRQRRLDLHAKSCSSAAADLQVVEVKHDPSWNGFIGLFVRLGDDAWSGWASTWVDLSFFNLGFS